MNIRDQLIVGHFCLGNKLEVSKQLSCRLKLNFFLQNLSINNQLNLEFESLG